jgi:hypothetical protein
VIAVLLLNHVLFFSGRWLAICAAAAACVRPILLSCELSARDRLKKAACDNESKNSVNVTTIKIFTICRIIVVPQKNPEDGG